MPVTGKRSGSQLVSLLPQLSVRGGLAAIGFYHAAFGAEVVYQVGGTPDNLSVVRLPPYRPELNPVERLWLYLRSHFWSNRVYSDLDALEEAAVSGWRAVCLHPDKIKTICRCEYLPTGS